MFVNTRVSSLAVTILAGYVTAVAAARAAGPVESDQVAKTLSDAKVQAFQLREDAEEMERFSRSTDLWESHAEAIRNVREDVNAMASLLTRLKDNRSGAAPWQQVAIDRIEPVCKELASNTTAAIDHLNRHPKSLNTPAYQNYLEAIADSARNLAATISDFVDYGRTKQRLDTLSSKLELPGE